MFFVFGFLFLLSGAVFGSEMVATRDGVFLGAPATVAVYRYPTALAARNAVMAYRSDLSRDRSWVVWPLNDLVLGRNFVDVVVEARQQVLGTSAAVLGEMTVVVWDTRFGLLVAVATYNGDWFFCGA